MATRLKGSIDSHGSYLYVDYTVAGQDVSGNYTDVSWTVGVHWGSSYFNIHDAQVKMSTTVGSSVGGTTQTGIYNSGWPVSGAASNTDKPFWAATTRVNHNSSGDGNIVFKGSAWWDTPSHFTSNMNVGVSLPHIARISAAPSTPVLSEVTSTTMTVTFTDGGGGAPIDSRQVGYTRSLFTSSSSGPVDPETIVSSGNSITLTGLTPGSLYYVWARTHNSAGYSEWSGRASTTTLRPPDAPNAPNISNMSQVQVDVDWTPNGDGGSAITGYQVGYGTSSSSPTSTVTSSASPKTITGLSPAVKYYFWVRAQNSEGYSPWSSASTATTIAGASVKVGDVWKPAIPYLKDGGVWKLVRPWAKVAGVWKETS